jgi:hypothetical protein
MSREAGAGEQRQNQAHAGQAGRGKNTGMQEHTERRDRQAGRGKKRGAGRGIGRQ